MEAISRICRKSVHKYLHISRYGLEDVCVGCGRTAEEIEAYPTLTNEQKSDVNKDALLRLETL